MDTEFEIKILDIVESDITSKLESLGAKFVDEYHYKRYIFDTIPKQENSWIRLRTDGKKSTLTYKNVSGDAIDGVKELEIIVEDFEKTKEMLSLAGLNWVSYQENNRKLFILDGCELAIDSWPNIPPYLEIEAKNQKTVESMLDKLDLGKSKTTSLPTADVYKMYKIDLNSLKKLSF